MNIDILLKEANNADELAFHFFNQNEMWLPEVLIKSSADNKFNSSPSFFIFVMNNITKLSNNDKYTVLNNLRDSINMEKFFSLFNLVKPKHDDIFIARKVICDMVPVEYLHNLASHSKMTLLNEYPCLIDLFINDKKDKDILDFIDKMRTEYKKHPDVMNNKLLYLSTLREDDDLSDFIINVNSINYKTDYQRFQAMIKSLYLCIQWSQTIGLKNEKLNDIFKTNIVNLLKTKQVRYLGQIELFHKLVDFDLDEYLSSLNHVLIFGTKTNDQMLKKLLTMDNMPDLLGVNIDTFKDIDFGDLEMKARINVLISVLKNQYNIENNLIEYARAYAEDFVFKNKELNTELINYINEFESAHNLINTKPVTLNELIAALRKMIKKPDVSIDFNI